MEKEETAFVKEVAQHTRFAHFSLIATSIVLIVLALTYREASVDRALLELADVKRLSASYSQEDILSVFLESNQPPVNFVGINNDSDEEFEYVCIPDFVGIRHKSWLDSEAHLTAVTQREPELEFLAEDEAPWIEWLLWHSNEVEVELPQLASSLSFEELNSVWENTLDPDLRGWADNSNALLWLSVDPVPDNLYRLSDVNTEIEKTPLAVLSDAWDNAHDGEFVEITSSRLLGVASWADSVILDFEAPQQNENIFRCLDDLGPTFFFLGSQIIELLGQPEIDLYLVSHDLAELVGQLGTDSFSANNKYVIGETGVITLDSLDDPTSASFSPAAYILEVEISQHSVSVLPTFLAPGPGELKDAPFNEAFDDLERNLGAARSLTVDEAEALLGSALFQSRNDVSLLGISFPTALATSSGLGILIVSQIYFLLHLQQFRRRFRSAPQLVDFPWIALYPDLLARTTYVVSVGLLPGLAILALSLVDGKVALGPQLIYTILFGAIGIGCAIATTITSISLPRFSQGPRESDNVS